MRYYLQCSAVVWCEAEAEAEAEACSFGYVLNSITDDTNTMPILLFFHHSS